VSDIMEKIIADLIKGAAESEGFMRGGKVNVEIGRDRGHETKLASFGGALGGGLLGGGAGALGGGLAGAGTSALLGKLLHLNPETTQDMGAMLGLGGAALGGLGGAAAGTSAGMNDPSMLQRLKGGALEERYVSGVKAAAAAFHVKEAFIGALLAGARALAPKVLPAVMGAAKSPIGQQALGMGAQMGVQKMMTPREPQQPPQMG
jgi:hypothetical protein